MAKSVKETATTANAHCQREWETESAEQKSAEDRRVQLRETTCRQRKERRLQQRGPPCDRNIAWSVGAWRQEKQCKSANEQQKKKKCTAW